MSEEKLSLYGEPVLHETEDWNPLPTHTRDAVLNYAPSDRQRLAELAGEVAEVCANMGEWYTRRAGGEQLNPYVAMQQWRLCLLKALREAQR